MNKDEMKKVSLSGKKKNNLKDDFIKEYGQEAWDLRHSYTKKGNRSPEAKKAHRNYTRKAQGLLNKCWSVYCIYQEDMLLYIGSTGSTINKRWTNHINRVKKGKQMRPLHRYMKHIVDECGGDSELYFEIFEHSQYETEQEAKDMELKLTCQHNPPFCRNKGGGAKSKLKAN